MPLNKEGRKLKKLFELEYTGKPVPRKYQSRYGKVYSKKEADSVFFAFERKHKGLKKR